MAAIVGLADHVTDGQQPADVLAELTGYLMPRVLHDWQDAEAAIMLARRRAACGRAGRLAVIDMDVGGRERSRQEFARLLAGAGFAVSQITELRPPNRDRSATSVTGRASSEAFGVENRLRELFELPTLAGQAELVETLRDAKALPHDARKRLPDPGHEPRGSLRDPCWFP